MLTSPATIKLSPRRHEQLRAIASTLGLSITDTIAHMIRDQIGAGVIGPDLPGVIARRVDDGVFVQIDDAEPATVSVEIARQIAEALRSVANGGAGLVNLSPFKARDSFAVTRKGTGVLVQIPYHGPTATKQADAPSFSASEARDVANVIEQAAG